MEEGSDHCARLVIVSHALSRAQEAYQEARELRSTATSGQYFYKDATPRAEHFMTCSVELCGARIRHPLPLKLTLCYDDGTMVPYEDQACLRLLKENVHVRPSVDPETMTASFTYRIEIGSFRRADRSFVVRIDADTSMVGWPNELSPMQVEYCMTPPIYVLSKKRLHGVVTAPSSPTASSSHHQHPAGYLLPAQGRAAQPYAAELQVPKKRKREDEEPDAEDVQRLLLEKMMVLERRVAELTTVVLSTVAAANVRAAHPATGNSSDQQATSQQHHRARQHAATSQSGAAPDEQPDATSPASQGSANSGRHFPQEDAPAQRGQVPSHEPFVDHHAPTLETASSLLRHTPPSIHC